MAISGFRALLWWSNRWSKKDWAIAAICFAFIVFVFSFLSDSWHAEDSGINHSFDLNPANDPDLVDLSLLQNAKAKGALCLDGSLPGYHFQKGFGSGSTSWVLHIEGGGWCDTVSSCSSRKMTPLGSSDYMERRVRFSGILSSDASKNPGTFCVLLFLLATVLSIYHFIWSCFDSIYTNVAELVSDSSSWKSIDTKVSYMYIVLSYP